MVISNEFEKSIRDLKETLERMTGFIYDHGNEEELVDLDYANNTCDCLNWILGEISTEHYKSDNYLNLDELEKKVKKIEERTGNKFEEYE